MLTFSIEKWEAWAPGLITDIHWREWACSPYCPYPAETEELPSTHFLPAMQRRRLSPLARMVFGCAWPLAENLAPMPVVFASRHGETTRSFRLLRDLAAGEPLSPTAFGLSVHNAILGQWSIVRKETEETIALAGDTDMLEHAVQEACMLLHAGSPRVLLVVAEERPPPAYLAWIDDAPFSYVVALRLSAGNDWQLGIAPAGQAPCSSAWPHPLNLLRNLINGTPSWSHAGPTRHWQWRRMPA
ncbi:beta-ketoacyl synthase chain length factor [Bordetella petrii]|uniref:Beta-ketoacyl synthase-like N-terminal domain-containing protein n=1 Tax=Bordetella petrii (strain ATCC BAA-461 / DSM 12804 / CCUG 43448 / CIP 107267 / Se-1111R) TaxID=340100 RepID=A9ICW7_BORPD|nr:beta-ketoacyl synthase chain length factor [Bordetella petrii]CAP44724.1 conserved hypothetical protein [Bordetella petrii]